MIDSIAKTDPGLYQLGITNIGKEDQCLRINYANGRIKGSYSMLSIDFPKGKIHNLPMVKDKISITCTLFQFNG